MKKFMIIGAAALMLVSGVAAIAAQPVSESPARTTEASAKTDYVDRKFNCRDFTGLDVSGIVKVKLAKSDFYKVKVTLPEELAEYLDVHVSEGALRIGWSKNIPSRIQRKLGDLTCTAEVTMPELRKLMYPCRSDMIRQKSPVSLDRGLPHISFGLKDSCL